MKPWYNFFCKMMIIFRKSDQDHLILHDPLTHVKRSLSPDERDEVIRYIPQLLNPKIDSWLVTDLPGELEILRSRE